MEPVDSSPAVYRRLTSADASWNGRSRLWLADDHFAEVISNLFIERYRRFYLRDITTLLIVRTNLRFIWNLIHGSCAILSLALAGVLYWFGSNSDLEELRIGLWIVGGVLGGIGFVFLLLLLVNHSRGATCECYVSTASGRHLLETPTRLPRAEKLLAALIPAIDMHQPRAAAQEQPGLVPQ